MKDSLKYNESYNTSLGKNDQENKNKQDNFRIYFENQGKDLLCGMHAINNFLGQPKHSVESMNQICYNLAGGKKFCNPHKHWFLSGDFDVNVLMLALQDQKYETKWHDHRKKFTLQDLNQNDGFLLNIQQQGGFFSKCGLFCCVSGRHWLTVKKLWKNSQESIYVVLDSSKEKQLILSQKDAFFYFQKVKQQNGQIISISKEHKKQTKKSNSSKIFKQE